MNPCPSLRIGSLFGKIFDTSEQTKTGLALRVTAISLGVIAAIATIVLITGSISLGHTALIGAWVSIGVSFVLAAAASFISCQSSNEPQIVDESQKRSPPEIADETQITNGHGEFVVFSKSSKEIDSETFEKAYEIFHKYSLTSCLNSQEGDPLDIYQNRDQLIHAEVNQLNPDLEVQFIPRTLYDLTFLRACIEEDRTANAICEFLDPIMHRGLGPDFSVKLKSPEEHCWHVCCFKDEGNPLDPKVVNSAYRVNQLFSEYIQNLNYEKTKELTESHIEYLKDFHQQCEDKKVTIGNCNTPEPTTNFGFESTRGAIKPMGIRDEKDAQIIRNALALECSELAQRNILLFRGACYLSDKPFSENQRCPYSLSFGTSLFAGALYDGGATSFHYMRGFHSAKPRSAKPGLGRRQHNDAFCLLLPLVEAGPASAFYYPLSSALCQMYGEGEVFHGRTKAWRGATGLPGVQQGASWEYLKSELSQEELIELVEDRYKEAVFLK